MTASPPADVIWLKRDIEGLRSPEEFVEALWQDVEPILGRVDRSLLKAQRLFEKVGGTQIGSIRLPAMTGHWKNVLSALFEDVARAEGHTLVLFWDELPLFLHNVKTTAGERPAMEILDVLRSMRQRHRHIRMVFTGSVGLHQVISEMRKARYANDPTNDMRILEVPPLAPADGVLLARRLIEGEGLLCVGDPDLIAQRISEVAGHIPFYIHYLVVRLKDQPGPVREADPDRHLELPVRDPNDPAHFSYYRQRLDIYYERSEVKMALAAMDALALAPEPLAFGNILNLVRHHQQVDDEESVRDVLKLLVQDHYLAREPDGRYCFRYPIVRRWWSFDRGI